MPIEKKSLLQQDGIRSNAFDVRKQVTDQTSILEISEQNLPKMNHFLQLYIVYGAIDYRPRDKTCSWIQYQIKVIFKK